MRTAIRVRPRYHRRQLGLPIRMPLLEDSQRAGEITVATGVPLDLAAGTFWEWNRPEPRRSLSRDSSCSVDTAR